MQKNHLLVLFLLITSIFAQTPIETLKLADGIYMIRSNSKIGNPSSVISVGKDGVLMVDANLIESTPFIRKELLSMGKEKVDLIINTHVHADHTEGNMLFGKEAIIISSPNLKAKLIEEGLYDEEGEKMPSQGLPDITIVDEMKFSFNGEKIRIIPLSAGHTNGDLAVYFVNSNVLAVGDYYFHDRYPVFAFGSGADVEGYLSNIEYFLDEFPDNVKIVPGHGYFEDKPISYFNKEDYRNWYKNIKETIEIIKEKIDNGKSLKEITEEGLPEKYMFLGERPRFVSQEKWIDKIFEF